MDLQLPAPALQDVYIPAALPSTLKSSFFILHSTPPRPTHSFINPPHYSFVFFLLPSIIRFSLFFVLNSLDHSPALMSSISLRIAELVQHRGSCVREIRSPSLQSGVHVSSHKATRRRHGPSPPTFRSALNPPPWPRWSSPDFAKRRGTTSSI
jgi:hypothetical protein